MKPARKLTLVGVGLLAVTVGFAVAGFGNLLSSIATVVAALTLAIGFASQDLIGNLVAGAFLIGDPKVNYPTLLSHCCGFVEGGASCFDDALCRHRSGVRRERSLHRRGFGPFQP